MFKEAVYSVARSLYGWMFLGSLGYMGFHPQEPLTDILFLATLGSLAILLVLFPDGGEERPMTATG